MNVKYSFGATLLLFSPPDALNPTDLNGRLTERVTGVSNADLRRVNGGGSKGLRFIDFGFGRLYKSILQILLTYAQRSCNFFFTAFFISGLFICVFFYFWIIMIRSFTR